VVNLKITVWEGDLSEDYLRWASQIGVDGIDIRDPIKLPGVKEQGYPSLKGLLRLRRRLKRYGLEIFRVSLPEPYKFLVGEAGGEEELEKLCKTIELLGEASIPIARPMLHGTPKVSITHMAEHRGGYRMRAFNLEVMKAMLREEREIPVDVAPDEHLSRCIEVYRRIVPVAEDSGVRLALHPSDPPISEAPFSTQGWYKMIEAVPSEYNGLLYCVGTRYEAGGIQLVLEEIQRYGRMGKIFEVHLRNVRGNLPATGGFEEAAIDDGDVDMLVIVKALKETGFDGPVNPDHVPVVTGDTPDQRIAKAYAVGYIRALLRALDSSP